jgi:hypothetical protein
MRQNVTSPILLRWHYDFVGLMQRSIGGGEGFLRDISAVFRKVLFQIMRSIGMNGGGTIRLPLDQGWSFFICFTRLSGRVFFARRSESLLVQFVARKTVLLKAK